MNSKKLNESLKNSNAKWLAKDNQITTLNEEQKVRMLGAVKPEGYKVPKATLIAESLKAQIPSSIDWRKNNGNFVTSIKDQGGCGSCVSFGITSTLESRIAIEHSMLLNLSEADAFFCSSHGAVCTGWWPKPAFEANQSRGICQEVLFPYASAFPNNDIWSSPPTCKVNPARGQNEFKYANINTVSGIQAAKQYLATTGPLAACFDVYEDFYSYSSGIYHHVTGSYKGGHCISIVGYNDADDGYWICKNSWGSGWGMNGYFNIAYGQCNIDTYEMVAVTNITLPQVIYANIKSNNFNNVFLRMDGNGVTSKTGPGSGNVNCQYGAYSWELFKLNRQSNGSYTIESNVFPNVFLRMDGNGVTSKTGPGGGIVNCQFGAYSWENFSLNKQSDGTYTIGSNQFPNVFLRMDGNGVTSKTGPGSGNVNCQYGAYSWEKYCIVNE